MGSADNEAELALLRKENEILKHENAMLNKQIHRLNARSFELRLQNNNLNEKLQEIETSNKKLEKIKKEKDELFELIIQDIKNPSMIIKNLVDIVSSFDNFTTDQQAVVRALVKTVKHVVNISQDISKVLLISDSEKLTNSAFIDPVDLIEKVIENNKLDAQVKQQTISTDYANNLPKFKVDEQKIFEVFNNLVSNAIKYTQVSGKIKVKVNCPDKKNMEIKVCDNGLGISEEELKSAFQRGKQFLDMDIVEQESQGGIGIWIVKRIVEAHKGRLWVESIPGRGSTFTVQIPIDFEQQI